MSKDCKDTLQTPKTVTKCESEYDIELCTREFTGHSKCCHIRDVYLITLYKSTFTSVLLVSGIASQNAMQNVTFAKQNQLCIAKLCESVLLI